MMTEAQRNRLWELRERAFERGRKEGRRDFWTFGHTLTLEESLECDPYANRWYLRGYELGWEEAYEARYSF